MKTGTKAAIDAFLVERRFSKEFLKSLYLSAAQLEARGASRIEILDRVDQHYRHQREEEAAAEMFADEREMNPPPVQVSDEEIPF
jgi:hypothetical protein